MIKQNTRNTHSFYPLSPWERAGVRAVARIPHNINAGHSLDSSPHPNPLPGGEGTGTTSQRAQFRKKPLAASHPFQLVALLFTLIALTLTGCNSPLYAPLDLTWDHDGIIRGDPSRKQLALIFTGGDHGEGTPIILDTLADKNIKASFFVTGGYVAQPGHDAHLQRIADEGHYLGPHSHEHLLYAPWDDREKTLVDQFRFKQDLQKNIDELRGFGAMPQGKPIYFIPPYEWYNAQHAQWAREMNCILFNFTPGTGSHRDWAPEYHAAFRTSAQILHDILAWEQTDPNGLNGHLLLLHLGSQRQDKMYLLLGDLIDALQKRGYELVRVDELLQKH